MSTHIVWQPIKSGKAIYSSSLKSAMEGEYGFPLSVQLGQDDIGFLKGLKAAKIEGAEKLLDAIYKYEEIRVETSE